MKKTGFLLFYFASALVKAQSPATDVSHWHQVWKSDFVAKKQYTATYPSGDPIDNTSVWNIKGTTSGISYWDVGGGDHGGEPQAYTPYNASFDSEGLVFTTVAGDYNCTFCATTNGVFLSGNSGTSWADKNTIDNTTVSTYGYSLTTNQDVRAFALSGNNLLVGTYGGAVSLSTYNTLTSTWSDWAGHKSGIESGTPPDNNMYVNTLLVSGSNLLAGTNNGVFLSTNTGSTWTAVNGTGSSLAGLVINALAIDGSNWFAATDNHVYLSSNGGTNWTAVDGSTPNVTNTKIHALIVVGRNMYAGTDAGVYKTSDAGTSWAAVNGSTPSVAALKINTFILSGSNLFVGTNAGAYYTANNGTSWTSANGSSPSLSTFSVNAFAVSGSTVFAGTNNGVYATSNSGTSWATANGSSPSLSGREIKALMVSGSSLFAGVSGASYPLHHYTSAEIVGNLSVQNVQYGYIEARVKLIDTYGLFPAFWTWVQQGTDPSDPSWDYDEIDVFEMVPGGLNSCALHPYNNVIHTKNYGTSNIHTNELGAENGCNGLESDRGRMEYLAGTSGGGYTGFHKFGIEWTPAKLIYYFDDVPFRTSPNPGFNGTSGGKISQVTHIILNQAMSNYVKWNFNGLYNASVSTYANYYDGATVDASGTGGTYAGPHDLNTTASLMKISDVTYYKPNNDCSTSLTITSATINAADSDIKNDITTSGTISLPASKIWRAEDFILLSSDFSIPAGSPGYELYLDVNPCY